jgi:membrane-bound lytic murein transglycosylase D
MAKVKNFQLFRLTVSILTLILITAVLLNFGCTPASGESCEKEQPKNRSVVIPAELPAELEFAGEKVPLELMDVVESLDRELLINMYWQSQTMLFLKKSKRFFSIMEPILQKNNVPDDFKYLSLIESGFFPTAVSPAGAVGLWQILEGTARDYKLEVNSEIDERYHIEKATEAACKYLLESFAVYKNWTMAAASYNAGRAGINRQIGRQKEMDYYDLLLTEETARYIYRILAIKLIIANPERYGFYLSEHDYYPQVPYYEVTLDGSVQSFAEFAKRYGISYKTLKWMNPWLRDTKLTNSSKKTYYVKIPRKGLFRHFESDEPLTMDETVVNPDKI